MVAGILQGWYQPTRDTFLINPWPADTRTFSRVEASEYSLMLAESGVEPLYRESEPTSL